MQQEGKKTSITVKSIEKDAWQKPGTETYYFDVRIEEYPSEPIRFVQKKDRGAPAPEVGKKYEGITYPADNGYTFYPSSPRPQRQGYAPKDDKEIRALAVMKSAVDYAANMGWDLSDEETQPKFSALGLYLYGLVDVLKGAVAVNPAPTASDDAEASAEAEKALDEDKPINLDYIPF